MPGPLRVLVVEDDPTDAALVQRRLTRAGFELVALVVENAAGLAAALRDGEWDIVLADYNLPGFSGMEALRMVMATGADLPLVLVSGAIDVPTALDAMKAGARDFVLKDQMERLPSVVEREMAEATQRRERRRAEAERDLALRELRESNDRLEAFVDLTDMPLTTLSFDELLASLLERIVDALGADGAALMRLEGGVLVTVGAVGPAAGDVVEVPFGTGFAGAVAERDAMLRLSDMPADDPSVARETSGGRIRAAVGVPMHYDERVTGVLRVDWADAHEPSPWEPPLIETAADRCAMAIENARLYAREHRIADTLQQALLSAPTAFGGVEIGHFYRSATEETLVGGDFYDLYENGSGRVVFAVGDVSGKGLGAASVTALVKNALRAYVVDGDALGVAMTKANDVMDRFTSHDTFVTVVLGELDVCTGALAYTSAGHTPAIVVGADRVGKLDEHGTVLGALPGTRYEESRAVIGSAECLVLYTDGLTEARSPDREFYGEERLLALLSTLEGLSPAEVAVAIRDELLDFSAGRLRDDVAVLVIRRAEAACPRCGDEADAD